MEKNPKDGQLTKLGVCYVPFLGWIPAVGFLFVEKDPRIRFQAGQSLVLHAVVAGVYFLAVPVMNMTLFLRPISAYVQGLVGVGFVLLSLWLLTEARAGRQPRLGWIAEWAEKMAK